MVAFTALSLMYILLVITNLWLLQKCFFPHVESFDIRKTVIKTTLRLHKYHLVASR